MVAFVAVGDAPVVISHRLIRLEPNRFAELGNGEITPCPTFLRIRKTLLIAECVVGHVSIDVSHKTAPATIADQFIRCWRADGDEKTS